MRIAISGTACQGKSTLIKDFINEWPSYKIEDTNYRDLIETKKLKHSKQCDIECQWAILNCKIDELQKYNKKDNVIFDRSPLDAIVYSLWSLDKQSSDIDKAFIDKCIPLVRESMKSIDIVFFTPITKAAPIPIVEDGMREIDEEYINEIDNIFKVIIHSHHIKPGSTPFLPSYDSPAIIEIFGSQEERIQMIRQYIDKDGDLIGESNDTSIIPEEYNDLNMLINQMSAENKKDKEVKSLIRKFKI